MKKSIYLLFFIFFIFNTATHAQWQKVNTLYGGDCLSLVVDDSIMYSSFNNDLIYRSTDNGQNWESTNTDFCKQLSVDNGLLIAFSEWAYSFKYSIDSGNSWQTRSLPNVGGNKTVDVFKGVIFCCNGQQIKISTDTGKTWYTTYAVSNYNLFIKKGSGSIFLFDYNNSQVLTSPDTGKTWNVMGNNIALASQPKICQTGDDLVVLADTGIYVTSDFGFSWLKKTSPPAISNYINIYFIDSTLIYTYRDDIYKSNDLGNTWQIINHAPPLYPTIIVECAKKVIVGCNNLAIQEFDITNGNITNRNKGVNAIIIGNILTAGDSIFVTTTTIPSVVFYSYNNGFTWNHSSSELTSISAIAMDRNKNIFISSKSNTAPYYLRIYKSADNAKTWQLLSSYPTIMSAMNMVAKDTLLYCATEYGVYETSINTAGTAFATNFSATDLLDIALFDNSIVVVSDSGIFSSQIIPPYSWFSDTIGIPSSNFFTSLAVNDTVIFATANTGVFRKSLSSAAWTRIGMFGKHPDQITTNSNGDAIIVCDKGIAIFYQITNKWNVINYGLPKYNGKISMNKLAVNDSNLFASNTYGYPTGLWKRPMSIVLSLGINDLSESDMIKAYPNPTNTNVTFTLDVSANQNYTLNIFDITGRNCYSEKFTAIANSEKNVDVRFLENGCYVFQFVNGNTVINKKIIVQH
jgi:hypothetical protein